MRRHRALELHQPAHGLLGDPARLLVAEDRDPVDRRDVDGVARGVLGDVARAREEAVAALQAGDASAAGRTRPGTRASPARAGRSGRSGCRRGRTRRSRCARRRARGARAAASAAAGSGRSTSRRRRPCRRARCGPRRGRSAVASSSFQPSRIGFGSMLRRAAARRADREFEVRRPCRARSGRCGRGSCRRSRASPCERAQPDLARVEAEGPREVVPVGLVLAVLARLGVEQLLEAAGLARARHDPDARTGAP